MEKNKPNQKECQKECQKELVERYRFKVNSYTVGKRPFKGGDIMIHFSGDYGVVVSKTPTTIEELKKYADIHLHENERRAERKKKFDDYMREHPLVWDI